MVNGVDHCFIVVVITIIKRVYCTTQVDKLERKKTKTRAEAQFSQRLFLNLT